jgi:hypothetical protein
MSYQEKNITVSLMSTLLLFGFYFVNVFRLYQEGNFNAPNIYSLWATIIVLAIIVTIVSSIITQIVFAIIHAVKTKGEEEPTITDERDKLIGLKGTQYSYFVISIGMLIAMGTLVMNQPPLVMFNLLILSGMMAEVVGDCARLYLYRRGA